MTVHPRGGAAVTVTSRRLRLTVGALGQIDDIAFTALSGVGHVELADELLRDHRVARGLEQPSPGLTVETVVGGASSLFDTTLDVEVPRLPSHPTEADLDAYRQRLAEASRRQWRIGFAQGRAYLAEGEATRGLVRVRATGAAVVLEVTFRPGVADADPAVLRADFLGAVAEARAAAAAR